MPRPALWIDAVRPRGERWAGDVAVDEGDIADELPQEQRGGDGTAPAIPRVLEVGDVALELVLEVFQERKLPELLARALGRRPEGIRELIAGGEEAGAVVPQRHDTSAGERRVVDDDIGLELPRVREAIRQDEPSFGVGVDDLDGLPVQRAEDVGRTVGARVRHVFRAPDDEVDLDVGLGGSYGRDQADDVRRAGHVGLHVAHAGSGLDTKPTGVEGDALPHEDDLLLGLFRRRVDDVGEVRLVHAALPDRDEELHPSADEALHVQHGALEAVILGDFGGGVGKRSGSELVRGLVLQVAGDADPPGDGGAQVHCALIGDARLLLAADGDGNSQELLLGPPVTGEILAEAVSAEHESLGERAEVVPGHGLGDGHAQAGRFLGEGSARGDGPEHPDRRLGDRLFRSQPEEHDLGHGDATQGGDGEALLPLSLELLGLDELGEASAQRPVQRGDDGVVGNVALEHADDEEVGLDFEGVRGSELKLLRHGGGQGSRHEL